MVDHFEIKTLRFEECVEFYSAVLACLQIELKWSSESAAGFGRIDETKVRFLIEKSQSAQNCHIAFSAPNRDAVDSFHSLGVKLGFKSNGEPGIREQYAPNYYASFLLDPDGNNIESIVYV